MAVRDSTPPERLRTGRARDTVATDDYQVRVSDELEGPDWDAFLAETPGGHHVQTSLWAKVKALLGWRATRVVVTRRECIVAGAQLLIRPLPIVGAVGYVPRGPVLALDDPVLTRLVIHELLQVAKARRVQYLVVQPPCNGEALAHRLPDYGFWPSSIEVAPTATVLLDLAKDLDVILGQMKEGTRRNIRRGLRKGIIVREGAESDLHTFYALHVATSQRQIFTPEPEVYFSEIWRVLSPHGYVRLFLAEYEGEAVSAQLVIPFGDTVLFTRIGWSGQHGSLKPNEVLEWTVIMWAKAQGYRYCDFEGIDLKAARVLACGEHLPASLTPSATSFKLGFGGQVTLFPGAYDYVYNPLLRWGYTTVFQKVAHWSLIAKVENVVRGLSRV